MATSRLILLASSLLAGVTGAASAQRSASPQVTDSARALARSGFPSLRWRNIGPFRGGRTVAVAGSYVDPRVFYFGGANGGVWKTTNGGQSWKNISDFRVTGDAPEISSVGAIAVAPSS